MSGRSSSAFTLAELLIALSILGIIATFAIPKILTAQQNTRQKATFQETIAALNEVFIPACQQGLITEDNFGTYMMNHLNSVKICQDSMDEGCWFGTDLVGQSGMPGLVLHNGAVIAGLDNDVGSPATGADTLMMDWNGSAGANTHGVDQIVLKAIINKTASMDRTCTIRWDPQHTASQTLWLSTFK